MTEPRMAWEGRAGQARVGHFIQGNRKTLDDIWEVLEMKHPPQVETNSGLWWRVANTTTGEELPVPPKSLTARVRFMLTPEEWEQAELSRRPPDLPHQWPVDSEEVLLLAQELGATEIASRDAATGEITCPNYNYEVIKLGAGPVPEIEHLRICHGLDVTGLEHIADGTERAIAITKAHGPLHGPESSRMAHKGFPHRHVPEDQIL